MTNDEKSPDNQTRPYSQILGDRSAVRDLNFGFLSTFVIRDSSLDCFALISALCEVKGGDLPRQRGGDLLVRVGQENDGKMIVRETLYGRREAGGRTAMADVSVSV